MRLIDENGLLKDTDNLRVFLQSKNVNIFPCSRRGPAFHGKNESTPEDRYEYYDPEARLNTERTNRLHSAVNGFANSFIESYDAEKHTLVFVLSGYRVEVKDFYVEYIASALGITTGNIYAHLRLRTDVSLQTAGGYTTEVLDRQVDRQVDSKKAENYLDVPYEYTAEGDTLAKTGDFFVGVSFTAAKVENDGSYENCKFYNLPLFYYANGNVLEPVQASFLPKIEHDETDGSIKVNGNFTVQHGDKTSFKITDDETVLGKTVLSELAVSSSISTPALKADSATVGSLTVTDSATLDKALSVGGKTTLNNGLDVTNGDTVIKGKVTAEKLVIPSRIDENGKEKGEVETPVLRVDRLTSSNKYNTITIDNKKLVINRSLEMLAKDDATDPAEATIEQAVIGDLTVKKDTKLKNSTGKITAGVVNSDDINQKINDTYYDVPVIFVQQLDSTDSDIYQLQISRANVLPYEPN